MKNLSKLHKDFTLNNETFRDVQELLTFSRSISKGIYSFFDAWFDSNPFLIVNTSGSTGKPAQIKLKKEHMINSALATGDYFDLHQHTKALLCLSPDYIAGKMMLVRAMALGWQLDIVEPDSHPLDKTESNYDFCAMVPLQLNNSLTQLHKVKKVIVGGGVVSIELMQKLQDISTSVYATYGMTETITHIAIKQLNHFQNVALSAPCLPAGRVERSHYKTLPNIQISKDNRGCLVIDAPKIADKQVVTNDIVTLISDHEFIWLGRFDTIINSGGVKLIPEQIEKKLSAVLDCRFFVAGIPDDVLGEKLVLVIEGDVTSSAVEKSQISNLKSLSKFEIPKEVFFVDQFVETETKKIQRQQTLDLIF